MRYKDNKNIDYAGSYKEFYEFVKDFPVLNIGSANK